MLQLNNYAIIKFASNIKMQDIILTFKNKLCVSLFKN